MVGSRTLAALVPAVLFSGILLMFSPGSGAVPDRPAIPSARRGAPALKLVVRGQAEHHGHVTVKGPHGFRRIVTRTTTFRGVPAGRYRVSAATASTKAGRVYPTDRRLNVTVRKHGTRRAVVDYATVVPSSTHVVAPGTIKDLGTDAQGHTIVTLGSGASGLDKGDVIAAGVGAQTPDGLLVKVISVQGSKAVTQPATLLDAAPSGVIDASATVDTSASGPPARSVSGAASKPASALPIDHDLSCSAGAKASIEGSLSVGPSFELKSEWHFFKVKEVSFTSSIDENAELKAEISGSASCQAEFSLGNPIRFSPITFYAGIIPIVVVPELQVTVDASGQVDAAVTTSASQHLGVTAGLDWKRDGNKVSPIATFTNTHGYQPPTLTGSAAIDASINPELSLLLYGLAGPEVGLTGGVTFGADINKRPWWNLDAYLNGNVGVTVPALDVDKRAILARKTWHIADSGSAVPGGGAGTGGSGSPSPGSGHGNGNGATVLIFGDDSDASDEIETVLQTAGYTVTVDDDDQLPADFGTYGQIWRVGRENLDSADEADLEGFVRGGGGLYLTGEWGDPTMFANETVEDVVQNLVSTGVSIADDDDDYVGYLDVNQGLIDGLATTPNAVSTWYFDRVGGLVGIADANTFAVNGEGNAAGAAWEVGAGRLAVLMDSNWDEASYDDPENMAVVTANLAHFLG